MSSVSGTPSPFLHIDADRIHDPVTGRTLTPQDLRFGEVQRAARGETPADAAGLRAEGWLVSGDEDGGHDVARLERGSFLRVVSLETATHCNQACHFCPVSIAPRPDVVMAPELFIRIVDGLTAYRSTLEAVFLQSYNEPTVERRFVTHCEALFARGLPVAVLSNGSGLTPAKSDALRAAGPLRYLAVNLSTLDPARYARDRGHDHLPQVLRNLDHAAARPPATKMSIVVLGKGDDEQRRDVDAVRARFAGTPFDVQPHLFTDRAGLLSAGIGRTPAPARRLAGCDNLGSRPFEHLHITPSGTCVLCCQDYHERHVVGDLRRSTIAEVLAGDELARLRRLVYGVDEAPADFICRRCASARIC